MKFGNDPVAVSSETGESGQILPLVTGFVVLAILLVMVTVDITALHLQRQELRALTDAAALDAADALDEEDFYQNGARRRPVALSDASVRASVRTYLEQRDGPAGELDVAVGRRRGLWTMPRLR